MTKMNPAIEAGKAFDRAHRARARADESIRTATLKVRARLDATLESIRDDMSEEARAIFDTMGMGAQ